MACCNRGRHLEWQGGKSIWRVATEGGIWNGRAVSRYGVLQQRGHLEWQGGKSIWRVATEGGIWNGRAVSRYGVLQQRRHLEWQGGKSIWRVATEGEKKGGLLGRRGRKVLCFRPWCVCVCVWCGVVPLKSSSSSSLSSTPRISASGLFRPV